MVMEQIRDYIACQHCPFCDSKKTYIVVAQHVSHAHGISAYELRELAGLNRNTSICDPDYSSDRAQAVKQRDPEELRRQLARAHDPDVVRETALRPEGRANRSYLQDPERVAARVASMNTPEANAKSSLAARNRSPEVVEAQTKRVQEAQARWLAASTTEEITESRRRAYQIAIDNTSQEYIHKVHVEAGAAAAKVIPLYHADPEWKARWRSNMEQANAKRAKVDRGHYQEIARRYWSGESPAQIALGYGCSRTLVRKIATMMVAAD